MTHSGQITTITPSIQSTCLVSTSSSYTSLAPSSSFASTTAPSVVGANPNNFEKDDGFSDFEVPNFSDLIGDETPFSLPSFDIPPDPPLSSYFPTDSQKQMTETAKSSWNSPGHIEEEPERCHSANSATSGYFTGNNSPEMDSNSNQPTIPSCVNPEPYPVFEELSNILNGMIETPTKKTVTSTDGTSFDDIDNVLETPPKSSFVKESLLTPKMKKKRRLNSKNIDVLTTNKEKSKVSNPDVEKSVSQQTREKSEYTPPNWQTNDSFQEREGRSDTTTIDGILRGSGQESLIPENADYQNPDGFSDLLDFLFDPLKIPSDSVSQSLQKTPCDSSFLQDLLGDPPSTEPNSFPNSHCLDKTTSQSYLDTNEAATENVLQENQVLLNGEIDAGSFNILNAGNATHFHSQPQNNICLPSTNNAPVTSNAKSFVSSNMTPELPQSSSSNSTESCSKRIIHPLRKRKRDESSSGSLFLKERPQSNTFSFHGKRKRSIYARQNEDSEGNLKNGNNGETPRTKLLQDHELPPSKKRGRFSSTPQFNSHDRALSNTFNPKVSSTSQISSNSLTVRNTSKPNSQNLHSGFPSASLSAKVPQLFISNGTASTSNLAAPRPTLVNSITASVTTQPSIKLPLPSGPKKFVFNNGKLSPVLSFPNAVSSVLQPQPFVLRRKVPKPVPLNPKPQGEVPIICLDSDDEDEAENPNLKTTKFPSKPAINLLHGNKATGLRLTNNKIVPKDYEAKSSTPSAAYAGTNFLATHSRIPVKNSVVNRFEFTLDNPGPMFEQKYAHYLKTLPKNQNATNNNITNISQSNSKQPETKMQGKVSDQVDLLAEALQESGN